MGKPQHTATETATNLGTRSWNRREKVEKKKKGLSGAWKGPEESSIGQCETPPGHERTTKTRTGGKDGG